MKTVINSLSFLLLFVGFTAFGMEDTPVYDIQQTGSKSFVLIFNVIQGDKGDLRIIDEAGTVIWRETLKKDQPQAKKYNLEGLPTGSYKLVVEDELRKEMQNIIIDGDHLRIDSSSRKTEFKPVLSLEGRQLNLNYLQQDQDLQVRIFDAEGRLLVNEDHLAEMTLERIYNLDALANGRYTVQVKTAKNTYTKSLVLK